MQRSLSLLFPLAALGLLLTGCAGTTTKFGRGVRNVTEFARMGEITRSIEQTSIYSGPELAYTTGIIHGVNRSLARTATGVYEIVTAPFPPYDPTFLPADPVYPDAYRPGLPDDSITATDVNTGFSGGEVAPFVPGSRFAVFNDH